MPPLSVFKTDMLIKDKTVSGDLIDRMWRFALSILDNQEDAEDVVQDVMMRFYGKAILFSNVEAYLIRSVRNASIDLLRTRKFVSDEESSDDPGNDPQKLQDAGETVRFAMSALPLKQRMAVQLKDIEGYSSEDVGKILGIKENQVRTILSRARKRMKETIEKEMNLCQTKK